MAADGPLGIIAGNGALPRRLVESCRAAGRPVFVLAFEGEADQATVAGVPHAWCRLGAAATALDLLHANAVTELVLAGGIRRPPCRCCARIGGPPNSLPASAIGRWAMTGCGRRWSGSRSARAVIGAEQLLA
jgi:hypothetical protein